MSEPGSTERDLRHRFGPVLLVLLLAYFLTAFTSDTLGGTASALALGVAWLIIVSGGSRSRRVIGGLAFGALLMLALATVFADERTTMAGYVNLLAALFVLYLPYLIIARMRQQDRIGVQTILGALCVYLLSAQFFSRLYVAADVLLAEPPLDVHPLDLATSQYLSYVALSTLGFGDITPVSAFGRAFVPLEALVGQLYLATTVAFLIGNLGATRPARR